MSKVTVMILTDGSGKPLDGGSIESMPEFRKWDRAKLQRWLEERGFGVYSDEPFDKLVQAAREDWITEHVRRRNARVDSVHNVANRAFADAFKTRMK